MTILQVLALSIVSTQIAMAVRSPVNFFDAVLPDCYEKPYQLKFQGPDGFPTTNIVSKEYDQRFEDIRGREADYSIARHGFAIMRLPETLRRTDYDDDNQVRRVYLKQVADSLKELLRASRVQIFEHTVSDPQTKQTYLTYLFKLPLAAKATCRVSHSHW